MKLFSLTTIAAVLLVLTANGQTYLDSVPQYGRYEINLTATASYENPYSDIEVWGHLL